MSGSQSPKPGSKPEKAMSSRLLTMKFMQRAAASSSSPSTPKVTTPGAHPPFTPNQRAPTLSSKTSTSGDTELHLNVSSKRQKLSDGTPALPSPSNQHIGALEAAIEAEERSRTEALARQAKEAGETEWVLSFADSENGVGSIPNESVNGTAKEKGPVFLSCGWGSIDAELGGGVGMGRRTGMEGDDEEEEEEEEQVVGRRAFGGFKRKSTGEIHRDSDSDSLSSSKSESRSSAEEDEDSDDPTAFLIRQTRLEAAAKAKADRKAMKAAEKAESMKLAQQRNSKTVNLNRLTSISSGGGNQGKCFKCGATDHQIQKCPIIKMERKRKPEKEARRARS